MLICSIAALYCGNILFRENMIVVAFGVYGVQWWKCHLDNISSSVQHTALFVAWLCVWLCIFARIFSILRVLFYSNENIQMENVSDGLMISQMIFCIIKQ